MDRQKFGQMLFWLGAGIALVGNILLWFMNPIFRVNTAVDLSGTAWDPNGGFLFTLQGISTGLGPFISLIGALLLSGKRGSRFWLWGFAALIAFALLFVWIPGQPMPALFGLGGGIIVISYFGTLWTWSKSHHTYEGTAKTGRLIQLLGYFFLFATALFLCIHLGQPSLVALEEIPIVSSESIVVAFSIGWLLLFIGNLLVARNLKETTADF